MRKTRWIPLVVLLGLTALWVVCSAVAAAEVPRMSKEELKGMLGSKDLLLMDVRAGKDWDASEIKITGAVRQDPKDFDSWAAKAPKDKTLVLYCA